MVTNAVETEAKAEVETDVSNVLLLITFRTHYQIHSHCHHCNGCDSNNNIICVPNLALASKQKE